MDISKFTSKVPMAEIQSLISKIKYPITKDQLVQLAKDQQVSGAVMGIIRQIGDGKYSSQKELSDEIKDKAAKSV